jgi:hypothetical protein
MARDDTPNTPPKSEREAKLAQALRANLRRRKTAPKSGSAEPALEEDRKL